MATRIEARTTPGGATSVLIRPASDEELKRLNNMMDNGAGEGNSSPARRMFKKTEAAADRPQFQKVIIDDEVLYARAFDYPAFVEFNMIARRRKDGTLDVSTEDKRAALVVALLCCGIVTEPSHTAPPRFTREEAYEGCESTDPEDHAKLGLLTGHVIMLNPHLFPNAKEKIQEITQEIEAAGDGQKKELSEPSTMPPTPLPPNGSPATGFTGAPVTSPSGSTAATVPGATESATAA